MKQYDYYVKKARNDRAIARTVSTSNEFVKEGNKRGLECRPDIVAYNEMKKECGNVNPTIVVGDLPGVQIGDQFTYRHQMAVVGLHRLPNVGIDYGHPPPDMIPTATAIVLMPKAGYLDDKDYGNTILYTGIRGILILVVVDGRSSLFLHLADFFLWFQSFISNHESGF